MRIIFLGLPLCALLLLEDGHDVVLAGVRSGLENGRRRLVRRLGSSAVVQDPHRGWETFISRSEAAAPDLVVSWFFTRRIPMRLCETARLGGVGVHPSLLPRHRGPDPYFHAILAGDAVSGVTAHRIEREYDTGAILAQSSIPIDPAWNAWELARALDRPSLATVRQVVRQAAQGDPLVGVPQDEREATEAPSPSNEARILRWNEPAEDLARLIRALAPSPGAVTWVGEEPIVVLKARVTKSVPRALKPGEAAMVDGLAVVKAADHGVALLGGVTGERRLQAADLAMLVARARDK